MTGHKKVLHRVPDEHLILLKSEQLGRHYHKVPLYIKELTGKYPRIISDYILSHYRINIELRDVKVQEHFEHTPECRYRSPMGKMGFSIDRPLLTELLESYYGGTTLPDQQTPPLSTSETRMRTRLGLDIALICARIVLGDSMLDDIDESVGTYEETHWGYRVELVFCSQVTGVESSICLYLDSQVVDGLIQRLSAAQQSHRARDHSDRRICQLPVQLDCILASAQMPLSSVLALQAGDIVMVRLLDRCEVHIKQQKLFYGAISEEDGALFLTSLDSVKSQ